MQFRGEQTIPSGSARIIPEPERLNDRAPAPNLRAVP